MVLVEEEGQVLDSCPVVLVLVRAAQLVVVALVLEVVVWAVTGAQLEVTGTVVLAVHRAVVVRHPTTHQEEDLGVEEILLLLVLVR